jgi:hypothetical protein
VCSLWCGQWHCSQILSTAASVNIRATDYCRSICDFICTQTSPRPPDCHVHTRPSNKNILIIFAKVQNRVFRFLILILPSTDIQIYSNAHTHTHTRARRYIRTMSSAHFRTTLCRDAGDVAIACTGCRLHVVTPPSVGAEAERERDEIMRVSHDAKFPIGVVTWDLLSCCFLDYEQLADSTPTEVFVWAFGLAPHVRR